MGTGKGWLAAWIQSSLRELLPREARITMRAVLPEDVLIKLPACRAAAWEGIRALELRFDQGVYSSLVVASPQARQVMGARLHALVALSLRQHPRPDDWLLVVHIDGGITARTRDAASPELGKPEHLN